MSVLGKRFTAKLKVVDVLLSTNGNCVLKLVS